MLTVAAFYWDPEPELFSIPFIGLPIYWYGLFFAAGFAIGFPLFYSLVSRYFLLEDLGGDKGEIKKKAMLITDRITLYMIISTVLGARLGHFLFYERPSTYLSRPWEIFRIWEGGLASHGAAIGIILGLLLFAHRYKKIAANLTALRLLDFISIPTAFAGGCIRIGNFFNQEILGTATDLPWAIIFGHPMDRSLPLPRHPVQLYEAFFYFTVFLLLWRLSYRPPFLLSKGRLLGMFLISVFGFRFVIEYFKTEQSFLLSNSSLLTMGQILSIPAIFAGMILLLLSYRKS